MSLLTVERNSPSPQESDVEETLSSSSHEGFVAREHYVTSLPPRPWASLGRHGGEQFRIFTHLKKVMKLLRNSDTIKLAVELENSFPRKVIKHLVLVATNGYQDTEEAIVLGTEQEDSVIRLGLVLPLWRDTEIQLDGDGGFSVHSGDRQAVFKPSSVQSMWTTLQTLYQATENARQNNYYVGGLSHTWMSFYLSQLTEDYLVRNEWNLLKDVETFRPDSPIYTSQITTKVGNKFEKLLVSKLREVMLHEDLEEVTSRQLRLKLEKEVDMQLSEYREFLDRHMLRILGQMEQPSEILDYLYLGSEWNASNLCELNELGVGYILNITREIDNFYPEVFKYLNIRLYDVPDSELIKHWGKTYRFIKEAKVMGTKVLVHCKMGISRSAATVMAYMMKEYHMTLVEAKRHVKGIRSCSNPNEGFMGQLMSYEGILTARHNPRWGRHAPTRLDKKRSMSDPDLFQSMEKEELERGDLERERRGEEGEDGESGLVEGGVAQHQFMHSRPIHNVASAYNIPDLYQHTEEQELLFLPEEEGTGQESHALAEATASPSQFSSEKNSLVHSTPVDKTRNMQTFLASLPAIPLQSGSNDDGIGENIPTSNSGSAYSSPMYTPPEEEHIHMHMSNHNQQQQQEAAKQLSESRENSAAEELTETEQPQPSVSLAGRPTGTGIPEKPSPPPTAKSSPPPPSSSDVKQLLPLAAVVNLPVSRSHRSNSLPHMHSGFGGVKKPNNVSPTSSRTSISSLARRSPAVLEEEEEGEGGGGGERGVQGGSLCDDRSGEQVTDEKEVELWNESPVENMTPRTREKFMHHRRTKSDTHDISGPIKTAQIFSVPERVKEIEEMSLQVATTQLLQAASVNQTDGHPSSPPAPSSSENRQSIASSMSNSSSEESLLLPSTGTAGNEDKSTSPPASSIKNSLTRHISLSPKPSSARSLSHLPVQTSLSLPTSVSPPEYETGSPPPPPGGISQDDLVSSLQGVVKAKIQDIEGKQGQQQQAGEKTAPQQPQQQQPELQNLESVVKRSSVSAVQRPSSEIIFHNPYIGVVEVSNPSDSESRVSSSSTRKTSGEPARPSHRHSACPSVFSGTAETSRERVQNEAIYNAWAGILPASDLLHSDNLASVLDLKQRFESNRRSPQGHRKAEWWQSSLRRSHSLRDTRLLSPPGLGQQYLSNTTLQLSQNQRSPKRAPRDSISPPSRSPERNNQQLLPSNNNSSNNKNNS